MASSVNVDIIDNVKVLEDNRWPEPEVIPSTNWWQSGQSKLPQTSQIFTALSSGKKSIVSLRLSVTIENNIYRIDVETFFNKVEHVHH